MAQQTFNEKLTRLEEIVAILEKGDVSLEQSLALFEEGSGLTKECHTLLQNATLKIQQFEMQQEEGTNE